MGLSRDEAYEVGISLGDAILACFEAIAKIDGTSTQEAIENWVSGYIANRIISDE